MMFSVSLLSVVVAFFLNFASGSSSIDEIDESAFAPEDIITKDVAIIGGGASGTYAAVRLREDSNVSVVVIEEQNRMVRMIN